ncbi:TNT domain-containing protein [Amycolatopsis anabasis]|uniref:TNT domain-containing protein n=1 Tax=Amycolatopsis anabasis TaxID=1840409 RepID=UPI00131BE3F3|nr:TNT domain-containing protein [Amycolatopsis anabasis]
MGIELPRELADIAAETQTAWPQADEDALREQAKAWRDAQQRLTALATDADATAGQAVGAMSGPAGEEAARLWSGFVDPDEGHLTTAARGAGQAAGRLEHAADQIGEAKVELVRKLVDAAKNRDAAHVAASAGHPAALLGLDTALRGTAANVTAVTDGLAGAIGPAAGPPVSAVRDVVDPQPGTHTEHGQAGLLGAVTGLPAQVLSTVDAGAGAVHDAVTTGPVHVDLPEPVGSVAAHPGSVVPDHPFGHPGVPEPGTGPIRIDPAPAAPAQYGGLLAPGGFDEVPTPSAGIPLGPPGGHPVPGHTVAAGFTDAALAPPPPAPVPPPPPAASPLPPPVAPPPVGYGPPPYGAPPAPPAAPQFGAVAGGVPGAAAPRQPQPFAPPLHPGARSDSAPPPPPPRAAAPVAPPPLGAPRQERESVIALFLVHMFPIGHLPVASDRPARQLPVPPDDVAYASGLRFPPHDHPRSDEITTLDALAKVREGWRRLPTPPRSPAAGILAGHDPLGELNERDWNLRYLAGYRGSTPEYAWPPGELHPEGCHEPGDPELLPPGTVLDRFGGVHGRVFAPDGTPFAQRALPPAHREAEYRRYRVVREVPMWQGVSAPWFAQPGGGVRYRAPYSADELVTLGYLADITFEEEAAP